MWYNLEDIIQRFELCKDKAPKTCTRDPLKLVLLYILEQNCGRSDRVFREL